MPTILLEATANSDIYTSLSSIFTFIVGLLGDFVEVITGTPLMFVPVLIAFGGGAVIFAVSLIKRLGVRGGGGRRRRSR